jgi:biotin carboxyl carrier protein
MKLELLIDGAPRTVELPADAVDVDLVRCKNLVYSVIFDGRACEVRIEHVLNGPTIVTIGRHRFEVEVRDPRRYLGAARAQGAGGLQQIKAPMPGKVVRVLVAAGDAVEAGQGIVVVEAMKMQNEIRAQRAGKVISLSAHEGATVTAGEILATVE